MSAGCWRTESAALPPTGRPPTVWRGRVAASHAPPNGRAWPSPRPRRHPQALLGAGSACPQRGPDATAPK
eukprot:10111396-Alexandrium_andersonii.AAC.1